MRQRFVQKHNIILIEKYSLKSVACSVFLVKGSNYIEFDITINILIKIT